MVLRGDYGDYRHAVRQLFATIDPMGLVAGGAPDDEYEPEINELLKWRRRVSSEDVREVFRRMFAPDGRITSSDAALLADGIATIRDEFGYTVAD
jgi:hypothetical protein